MYKENPVHAISDFGIIVRDISKTKERRDFLQTQPGKLFVGKLKKAYIKYHSIVEKSK